MAVLDFASFGSSLSVRVASRLGSSLSVAEEVFLGSSLSLRFPSSGRVCVCVVILASRSVAFGA